MLTSRWTMIPVLVSAGMLLAGCQHAAQSGAASPGQPKRVVQWTSLLCTPSIYGVDVSVRDVDMGTQVVFEAPSKDTDALRAAVSKHAQPVAGRAASVPVIGMNALPGDTKVTIENVPGGAAVTYTGKTAEEQNFIRAAVGPAARGLDKGQCTMLQAIAWVTPASPAEEDQDTHRLDPSERAERFTR